MIICKRIKDIEKQLVALRKEGKKVSFAPTMGALHSGHISLVKARQKAGWVTVCSIFVNPTQFNDKADFEKYPITIEGDIMKLIEAGCDILFLPTVAEMYPDGFENKKPVDFGFLAQTLEGEHRPGHFDGMAQIVEKLLRIVKPDTLYMGQKDYQQQLIVSKLIEKRKLPTKLIAYPTLREKDGLAMSSRNVRLDAHSRKVAVQLSKVLRASMQKVESNRLKKQPIDAAAIMNTAKAALAKHPEFEVEYYELRDAANLQPVTTIAPKQKVVALVAAKIGGVRLIDNMVG